MKTKSKKDRVLLSMRRELLKLKRPHRLTMLKIASNLLRVTGQA